MAALQEPCKGITHAYFSSYIHREDLIELRDLNVPLFKTFLDAIDAVAESSLDRVLLQTGGKVCIVHPPYQPVTAHMTTVLWMQQRPNTCADV